MVCAGVHGSGRQWRDCDFGGRHYANLNGAEDVYQYEIWINSITVQFRDKSIYKYSRDSVGAEHLAMMVKLAECGQGLGKYIRDHVRDMWLRRWVD